MVEVCEIKCRGPVVAFKEREIEQKRMGNLSVSHVAKLGGILWELLHMRVSVCWATL